MSTAKNETGGSSEIQGRLWGRNARDWAEIEDEGSRALFEAVLDATKVGKETVYLDVGCGSGLACGLAAARGAKVSGLDATPELIEIARERVPGGAFRLGDMEKLPFADDTFNVVTGFNCFFFAADEVVALCEAGRVAQPGASIAIVHWGQPDEVDATAYLTALAPLMPPPPPDPPSPFANPGELEDLARRAGLKPLRSLDVACPWVYPDLATIQRGLLSAGPSALAIDIHGEQAVREAIAHAVKPFRTPAGGYRLENVFRCLIATP